jgi:hypothetical protein
VNQVFQKSCNLIQHTRVHTGKSSRRLTRCLLIFFSSTINFAPIGERPFLCDEPGCNKRFGQVEVIHLFPFMGEEMYLTVFIYLNIFNSPAT